MREMWYSWNDPAVELSERLTRIAGQVLGRLPRQDLATLQAADVKISNRRPSLLTRIGEASWEKETGFVICSVREEPEMSEAVLAGILAHELAHARLGHPTRLIWKSEADSAERLHEAQAEALARRWGFAGELQAANEYAAWRSKIIAENANKFSSYHRFEG